MEMLIEKNNIIKQWKSKTVERLKKEMNSHHQV